MIVVQTPLRISFLGGGTDFQEYFSQHNGAVLSTAINLGVYIIIKERREEGIHINYSKKEIVRSVDEIEHDLVRETMRLVGVKGDIEVTTLGDVTSQGSGLGSSSSFTVGMLHALYAYRGELPTARQLAEDACKVEIEILGRPIGKQDQYITAHGGLRFITFSAAAIHPQRIDLPVAVRQALNRRLMLFYTGRTRKSSSVLESQKNNIEARLAELGLMTQLAYDARQALESVALDDFGDILHQGWEFKKRLTDKVSTSEIDGYYARARDAGAIGGKLCGAGGGGFLLLYCPPEKQEAVRGMLDDLPEYAFSLKEDGSKVIFNYRG